MTFPSLAGWFKRPLGKDKLPAQDNSGIPAEIVDKLGSGKASGLRNLLKSRLQGDAAFPLDDLLTRARSAGWSALELEKLAAYCDFFSGQSAAGYHRVMMGHLAETDYDLFMTAAVHCYLFDRYEEGYELLQQFKEAEAESLDPLGFLAFAGYMTLAAGRNIADATSYFDRALDQGLKSALLAVNAYPIYFEAGRHDRVLQLRELIQQTYADDPEAIFAIACVELCRGYYPEGFRLAESRYKMPEVGRSINSTLLSKTRWQGEPLAGKTLLVHGEQGYGDLVMMARYFPILENSGTRVVVDCREAAVSLLKHNFPGCQIVAGDQKSSLEVRFDCWTGIMSLPHHFNTTADTVPSTSRYLTAPPEQSAYWKERIPALCRKGLRIGLAWSGNPGHRADKRRSVPFSLVDNFLRQVPEVQFVALQTSVPSACPANLIDVSDEMVTLADTAALIAEMDLVITVDTSVVHIAGALGIRTWLMLPYRYEWRWGLDGERNNWYDSVSVLRQRRHGEWDSVLEEVFLQRLPALALESPC